ncbi:hypothetical protein RRG08_014384 [Elysia crispata]|uniref:Uncharacterized protein n=1 Tax=Elysia crispata TaxID=231223 RepID=A0AAE0YPX5_9GAST|nr:hypothetical protein RRG08_014384 [Elysia crispata]
MRRSSRVTADSTSRDRIAQGHITLEARRGQKVEPGGLPPQGGEQSAVQLYPQVYDAILAIILCTPGCIVTVLSACDGVRIPYTRFDEKNIRLQLKGFIQLSSIELSGASENFNEIQVYATPPRINTQPATCCTCSERVTRHV